MTEILPRIERAAVGEPEPRLTVTEFTALLHAAAELERAQRPIYLHPFTQPDTAPHLGVNVAIPAAPVTVATRKHPERSWWPLVLIAGGCSTFCACVVTAVTNSPFAILAVFASVAVWGTALYQLVFVREP